MLNRGIIRFILGKMLLVYVLILAIPLLVALGYGETKASGAFLVTMTISLALGVLFKGKKPKSMNFTTQEGILTTALIWLVLIFLGAFPFYLSGAIPNFTNAFFETASGFTTTGSSILNDIEVLPKSMLFWRTFTHFIGGMGVLVFAFAIMSESSHEGYYLLKSEMTGSVFGKLVSRLKHTAIILYGMYTAMTILVFLLLLFGGLSWFDALTHAFSTAGTGGFSNYNDSIAHFASPYVHYVISIGMLAFSINFQVYFLLFFAILGKTKGRNFLKNEEVRWFLSIVAFGVIFMAGYLYYEGFDFSYALRNGLFMTAAIISTTGFGMIDFMQWPLFAQLVVLFLMFVGGCTGSTAGGFKVSRLLMSAKVASEYLQRIFSPRRMTTISRDGKPLSVNERYEIGAYFILYALTFWFIFALICFDQYDFETTFSATLAAFNNIGPGLGEVGSSGNFYGFSDFSKWVLSIGMVAGRLEIIPILLFFYPNSWRMK